MLSVPDEELYLCPSEGVASVTLDGEAVVSSEETAGVLLLDPSATASWERLDASAPLSEVIADLATQFATEPAAIADDVRSLVLRLNQQRLLTVVEGAEGD